jgi:three-Cys-motif partner protein
MPKKKDRWPELCKSVELDDGLPVRDAGPWTEDKLYFWNRYIDIATSSMVDNPKWAEGVAYVDLFGGPGVCRVRDTGKRIPGSPLLAAMAPKAFRSIQVCERDASHAGALEQRLGKLLPPEQFHVHRGDCNEQAKKMKAQIPAGALTLAFIDPEGLHVWFETIETLGRHGKVDLLILFADDMDIVRNVDLYHSQKDSNLDRMLGRGSTWRAQWEALPNRSPANIRRLFANEYEKQLRDKLNYLVFREKSLPASRPFYRLIFASKHPRGADFWDKITRVERGGQQGMF